MLLGTEWVDGVADVQRVRGADAPPEATADLLLEVPHGATEAADFDRLARELEGPFPEGLRGYFFVNTDVGAPEVAERLAARVVADDPRRTVCVVRSRVPRTFVDCNRVIDAKAVAEATAAGEMTPGIASYVRNPADVARLRERHAAYAAVATRLYDEVCGAGGLALMVHSYAPREVDVAVDERIVERLREAYLPENEPRWPLRPEADLITRTPDGVRLADEGLVRRVLAAFAKAGVAAGEGATYALHPKTMGHVFAARHPGRTLCLEMRRDLLMREWRPFREMEADPAKVDRMAEALAEALLAETSGP